MNEGDKNFLLHDAGFIKTACIILSKKDKKIKKLITMVGQPISEARQKVGFANFVDILISQQISKSSATSIHKKFLSLVKNPTPENILKHSSAKLRAVGLSRQKIDRIQLLAQATLKGEFRPSEFKKLKTHEVISQIVAQKGFGDWSAETFVLFYLGRADIFPKGDLALQLAHQHLYHLDTPLVEKDLEKISLLWQPYRSVVALL
ncbi:MAG: DNA-3-methyladenine glycosylase family protein, partial [Alphaproteobacteria bacterium]